MSVLLRVFFWAGIGLIPCQASETSETRKGTVTVHIFLDESCPIARFYTLTLRELHERFESQGVVFRGYFPSSLATDQSVRAFAEKFKLPFVVQADAGQAMARKFKAKTVPEVFVFDREENLVYRGRIDDTFADIGRKRPVTQTDDLRDVLHALSKGKALELSTTSPVGCPITYHPKPSANEND